uniref:Uncharacterized protein n=1 Tax=Anopheles dirus TaxID=7168 RepID=A0A182NY04_9DIPT
MCSTQCRFCLETINNNSFKELITDDKFRAVIDRVFDFQLIYDKHLP